MNIKLYVASSWRNEYYPAVELNFDTMLTIGITGRQETVVTNENVATNVDSGKVRVFATPMLIALMEKAAALSIEPFMAKTEAK